MLRKLNTKAKSLYGPHTYCPGHGQNAKNSRAVPINYAATCGFDPKQFVGSVRLQEKIEGAY